MPCPSCWQSGNTGTLGPDARPGPISSQLMILPCFCSHSAFGTTTIPFPLQAFWPAQLPPAPAHAPLPLHSLMPVHFTLSPPALSSARAFTAPLAKSVAAAVAMRMPLLTRFINFSFPLRSPSAGRPPGGGRRKVARLGHPGWRRVSTARSATPSGFHGIEGGRMRRLDVSNPDVPGWLVALLLAVAIAATYSNGLHVPFVFDDWHTIEQNPAIRTLGRIPGYFVDPDTTTVLHENKDLRPILLVTMALNYRVSGLDPWSYHVMNLLLHWLVTLLVFRIVRDHLWLGAEATPVALSAALIVAVHPLNSEPVNYVSARSALLTAVFYLAAFD